MTPAEELHAAAANLRALATAASAGPWTAEPVVYGPPEDGWGEPSNWEISSSDRTVVAHQQYEGGGIDHAPNAAWIAAVHPGVGPALAELLDDHAARLDATTHPGWQNSIAGPALAVARTLLQRQP
ncbi:hypothetical protein [Streptomyces sp. NPDC058674]|uniref:hypothetical protein n=1 Tax=Streptomyces sp. NPDC058674 TaxID=3346592 RepID=UPI003662362B